MLDYPKCKGDVMLGQKSCLFLIWYSVYFTRFGAEMVSSLPDCWITHYFCGVKTALCFHSCLWYRGLYKDFHAPPIFPPRTVFSFVSRSSAWLAQEDACDWSIVSEVRRFLHCDWPTIFNFNTIPKWICINKWSNQEWTQPQQSLPRSWPLSPTSASAPFYYSFGQIVN